MAIKNVVGAAASIGLVGCDQSKAELDSTKQQLATVTTERDSLKTQLAAASTGDAAPAAARSDEGRGRRAARIAPSGAPAAPHHASKGGSTARPRLRPRRRRHRKFTTRPKRAIARCSAASTTITGDDYAQAKLTRTFDLVGIAILIATLWKSGAFHTGGGRFVASLLFIAIIYLTFQPSMRFQFLGWFVAATIILSSGLSFVRRAQVLVIGLVGAVSLFAVAGALRNDEESTAELEQSAWERFAFAEDANMLDGFVLLRQVYPERLGYSYGGEHLEILERPIPRAWWPDKPVGGYMNKLGIITADSGFTLGISPSLFGSFYQEDGLVGVVLLSIIYGFGFGRLVSFSTAYRSSDRAFASGHSCCLNSSIAARR